MVLVAENEEGKFVWHHENELHGRLGIVSKEKNSKLIKSLKREFKEKNEVNYHITTAPFPGDDGETIETLSIFQFEEFPSDSENGDFAQKRMQWVQSYFSLLATIHDKNRRDFIPLASFRGHAEGPLIGYYRAIQEMGDSDDKNLLNSHLQKLEHVKWSLSEEGHFTYHIEGSTDEELLESLYIGAWSFWLYTAFVVDERSMNLFVELDGLLVHFPVLGEKRDTITFIVDTLARLTFSLRMSYTIKSPTLFPMPESLVEHILVTDVNTADMNWFEVDGFPENVHIDEVVWIHHQTMRKMKTGLADSN